MDAETARKLRSLNRDLDAGIQEMRAARLERERRASEDGIDTREAATRAGRLAGWRIRLAFERGWNRAADRHGGRRWEDG